MADNKPKYKKLAPWAYDQEKDEEAVEKWDSLKDRVASVGAGRPAPTAKEDLERVAEQSRSGDRKAIESIFGKDIGPSKKEKEAEMFDKKAPDTAALAERIKKTKEEKSAEADTKETKPRKKSLAESVKSIAPPEDPRTEEEKVDEFAAEGQKVRDDYKAEREGLERRELAETIGNALGKIGGGIYGNNTGTDMSGVKFETKDWDKKVEAAQRDKQLGLADLGDRRKEKTSKDQFAADQDYKKQVLAETVRHNKAVEKLSGAKVVEAGKVQMAKLNSRQLEDFKKRNEKVSTDLYRISSDLEKQSISEDMAKERITSLLQNQLGLSPDAAKSVVVEEGWFGLSSSLRDPSEIQSEVNALAANQLGVASLKASLQEGEILVVGPDGNPGAIPADQKDAYLSAGYRVL